jgi:hypothetical protein
MNTRHEKAQRGSGKRREELLQVRVAHAEKETFEDAANLSGLALSAWVRERLRSIAMRELQAAAKPVPFLDSAKE